MAVMRRPLRDSVKSLLAHSFSLLSHVLSFVTLDVLRSASSIPPVLRVVFQLILREKVFPNAFCERFDTEVSPHLSENNDGYLFGDTARPHQTLLRMFDDFMATIWRPYTGRNFLEIGVGGGVSAIVLVALGST